MPSSFEFAANARANAEGRQVAPSMSSSQVTGSCFNTQFPVNVGRDGQIDAANSLLLPSFELAKVAN